MASMRYITFTKEIYQLAPKQFILSIGSETVYFLKHMCHMSPNIYSGYGIHLGSHFYLQNLMQWLIQVTFSFPDVK